MSIREFPSSPVVRKNNPLSENLGFPCGSAGKESSCNEGDLGLIRQDPLEKGKATRSSILTWRIPWTVWSCICIYIYMHIHRLQRVWHNWATFTFTFRELRSHKSCGTAKKTLLPYTAIKIFFLSYLQYSIINHSHHAIHCSSMTFIL